MSLSFDEESVHKIEQAIIVHTHRYFYLNNVEMASLSSSFCVRVCIFVSMFFYSLCLLLLIYEQF